jgi:hypothetical protein
MRSFAIGIPLLTILCTVLASTAAADVIPPCRLPVGVQSTTKQDGIPSALRTALAQRLGELVSPESPFDPTDVAWTGHNRRLIFIWTLGNRWIVATEHGGRVYNDPIFAYSISPDGEKATLLAERIAIPKSVCSTAEELLNLQPEKISSHQSR